MNVRKIYPVFGVVCCSAAVALIAAPRAWSHRAAAWPHDHDMPVASCSDLHMRNNGHEIVVQSEDKTITKAEAPTLRITAESNGGLQVQGWDQDGYGVTLCKAAESGADAQGILSQIHLTFQNGELGVTGPGHTPEWSAYLLVHAPKASSLDLHVKNGPMGVYSVNGNVKVHAANGPVTIRDCDGQLELSAQNGPVTLDGNHGQQHVEAANGPVELTLSGQAWQGSGVQAHAQNGPVTLRIPSGYQSGVVLESDGNGPFECRASVCSEGRKTWDDDHKRIEFGNGPTLIRLSAENGPVSVH